MFLQTYLTSEHYVHTRILNQPRGKALVSFFYRLGKLYVHTRILNQPRGRALASFFYRLGKLRSKYLFFQIPISNIFIQ